MPEHQPDPVGLSYRGTVASCVCALALNCALAIPGRAETVPATSNPWLAGMPVGSTDGGYDSVPGNAPVLVTTIDVSAVEAFTVQATGGAHYAGGCDTPGVAPCNPPDGIVTFIGSHTAVAGGVSNGIANVIAPYSCLLGVFLDDSPPDATGAPAGLDFSDGMLGRDFATLAPELKQVFFVGDGSGSGGNHVFTVPAGATRLFLGIHDGFGWFDNSGQFDVVFSPLVASSAGAVPDGHRVAGTPLLLSDAPNGDITLSWTPSCNSMDDDYAIYEGAIGDFGSHVAVRCTTAGATTATITPSSVSSYYLVVPTTGGVWEGSYGVDSGNVERPQGLSICLQQQTATCS